MNISGLSLSYDTCIAFPNIREPCSSKLILRFTFIHVIPFYSLARPSHAHQHTNLPLFLTVLNNTCPSTSISGHNTIPPVFCHRYNTVLTSHASSSCSSGLLATLLVLLCKTHFFHKRHSQLSGCFTEHSLFTNYLSNYSFHQVEHFPSLCCPSFSPLVLFLYIFLLFLHTDMSQSSLSYASPFISHSSSHHVRPDSPVRPRPQTQKQKPIYRDVLLS